MKSKSTGWVKLAFIALSLAMLAPAYAWDCSYWSQSSDPNAECYKPPAAPGGSTSTSKAHQSQHQRQTQRQRQSQVAKGGNASAVTGPATATVGNVAGGSVGPVAGGAGGAGGMATGGAVGDTTANASNQGNATSDASNQGNSQTTQYQGDSYPRQTPMAVAGFVQPTSTCTAARNGGASSPVAGISFGVSTKDEECDLRETARMFHEMGQAKLAVELLCKSKAAQRLKECGYVDPPPVMMVQPQTNVPKPEIKSEQYATKEELKRAVEHGLGK